MEKTKWPEKVISEGTLERIGEERTVINNILHK